MSPKTAEDLEALGQLAVARGLAVSEHGSPGSTHRADVEAWLRSKELERSLSSSASADVIARQQLRIAKMQTIVLIVATIVSAITAMVASESW